MRKLLKTIALCAAGVAVPAGTFWAAGDYHHRQDLKWCANSDPALTTERQQAREQACINDRESRRWGPFLAIRIRSEPDVDD